MPHTVFRPTALAAALALAFAAPAFAQNTPDTGSTPDPPKKSTTELEKIVVTGSRIKRVEVEGAAPVVTITADDIKREGFTTVVEALQSLTMFANNPQPDVGYGGHAPGAKPLNLRDFGPGRSLLLINGQRVADYPEPFSGQSNFSNYGNIPAAAIDRIEILATGASAIYGSDAVSGVVNVILKKNYEGDTLSVRAGGTQNGGGAFNDISLSGGKKGDNWSLTYALESLNRQPIIGASRPAFDSTLDKSPLIWNQSNKAVGIQEGIGIRMIDADTGHRIAPPAGACDKFNGEYNLFDRRNYARTGLGQGTVSDLGFQCGEPRDFAYNTFDNGNKNQQAYLYGTWNFTDTLQAWSSLAVYETLTAHQTDAPFVVLDPNGDYTWFDSGMNRTVTSAVRVFTKHEVGTLDQFENHTRDRYVDFNVGLRGKVFGDRFDWEAALHRSQDKTHESYLQLLPGPVDNYFLGPQLGTTSDGTPIYNLDQNKWWSPISRADFAKISTHVNNDASAYLNEATASITGDLFQGWAGPIGFAAEAEAARQSYNLTPDQRLINGDFGPNDDLGFTDQGGGSRNRFAVGTEFRVPVISTLTATIGTRWDKYNAVKDASHVSYMGGLEYRPLDDLLLRGTYATSFRAPDMHYTYARASSQLIRVTDAYLCQKDNSTYPDCGLNTPYLHDTLVTRQGSTSLDYEKGHSFTYGFVWNALDNLSVSSDYWYIFLKNEIKDVDADAELEIERACAFGPTNGEQVPTPGDCAFVQTRIHRDPVTHALISVEKGPINSGGFREGGIDTSLKYKLDTARWGSFRFDLDYTLYTKKASEDHPGEAWVDQRPYGIRSKVRGTIAWDYGKWSSAVYGSRQTGQRSAHESNCVPLSDGFIPGYSDCTDPLTGLTNGRVHHHGVPAIFYNVSAGYQINDRMRINGVVYDVTNKSGNNIKDKWAQDYAFTWFDLYNLVGRQYSLEFTYKFD